MSGILIMKTRFTTFASVLFVAALLAAGSVFGADGIGQLQGSFDQPPDDARIMARWSSILWIGIWT